MVQKAVEQSRSEDRIVIEDAGPLLIDPVGCNQGGAALIAMADDLKQAVGAELVDRKVAEFVELRYAQRKSTYVDKLVM